MSSTTNRMLVTCTLAFLISGTLVACGVFAALSRTSDNRPDHRGSRGHAERAAMEVVVAYYDAIDRIGADGGAGRQRVAKYVTHDHGSQLSVAFASMRREGWSTSGKTVIVSDEPIGGDAAWGSGTGSIGVRVCLDVSETRVIGPLGDDQTPVRRAERVPYDVWLRKGGQGLRVESTTVREELAPC